MRRFRPAMDRDMQEGKVLANRYEIVRELGHGNNGITFLCKDNNCGNEQKVLEKIDLCYLEPGQIVQTKHEAKLLSQLDHPGIVKFLDSFIDGEYYCVITEYYEGSDLSNKIEEYKNAGKSFDEETVLDWTIQLLLAVQYIHSRRVLHRDLKARNIFMSNNLMKIGNFGFTHTRTTCLASVDTPYYISPELILDGYSSKSEIWCIGSIMYQLCSLDHYFKGQGCMSVFKKVTEGDPPDLPSKYSRKLNEIFKIMLTKDPDKRPSAEEVLTHPYIAQHMTKMKDTLTDEYKARHNITPETADKETTELASLMREKSHLNDFTGASGNSDTEGVVLSEDQCHKLPAKKDDPKRDSSPKEDDPKRDSSPKEDDPKRDSSPKADEDARIK